MSGHSKAAKFVLPCWAPGENTLKSGDSVSTQLISSTANRRYKTGRFAREWELLRTMAALSCSDIELVKP